LERLDEVYRALMCWLIRAVGGGQLNADDIADIWQTTLTCVVEGLQNGKFKSEKGSLKAYLRTIATRRAVDACQRRRVIGLTGLDLTGSEIEPAQAPESTDDFLDELKRCFQELPSILQQVLIVDVELFYRSGWEWVSLRELTDTINLWYGTSLPETTVKSRRARARNELRRLLRQRGYGE
jgi:DNA-directed RNA polymerase specialized sigma24 family protein